MKISLCQINLKISDLKYNIKKIKKFYDSEFANADLVIFPELSLTGYLLKDLVNDVNFLDEVLKFKAKVVEFTKEKKCALLFGCPVLKNDKVFNSVIIACDGEEIFSADKHILPNYGVFNEPRNFSKAEEEPTIFEFRGEKLGILICEDAWHDDLPNILFSKGATLFIIVNASPYDLDKQKARLKIANNIVKKYNKPVAYLNNFGGYDELVFDGGSFVMDKCGNFINEPSLWDEGVLTFDSKSANLKINDRNIKIYCEEENIYQALVLSVKDYFKKNKFTKAVLGLSGGIDSALVAIIAADALGLGNVKSVILPTEYNSDESMKYALELVHNIGCEKLIMSIDALLDKFNNTLKTSSNSQKLKKITIQNLQARIRAVLLMAISNEENSLLLATSNKSESAVGYTTIYGDMCGGFAPIKDVYKTQVYKLADWRNKNIPIGSLCPKLNVIPNFIIEREPSAELSHNQKDSDSLLPYEILDTILYNLLEMGLSHKQISEKTNVDEATINNVANMIKSSEYKRSQAPIGPKISSKSFNYDRIYPISYYMSTISFTTSS
ncbi:MAG: NAD+ synthase [Candidatus Midichloriaceae bacterium]